LVARLTDPTAASSGYSPGYHPGYQANVVNVATRPTVSSTESESVKNVESVRNISGADSVQNVQLNLANARTSSNVVFATNVSDVEFAQFSASTANLTPANVSTVSSVGFAQNVSGIDFARNVDFARNISGADFSQNIQRQSASACIDISNVSGASVGRAVVQGQPGVHTDRAGVYTDWPGVHLEPTGQAYDSEISAYLRDSPQPPSAFRYLSPPRATSPLASVRADSRPSRAASWVENVHSAAARVNGKNGSR